MKTDGFMHKYYDWSTFEGFIKELYDGEGNIVVERDVTDIDRYGAKRQTDVKITRRTRFHTYVTLVECKRWKEPVGRDRIDVIASSVDALGANKGAVFTTKGFEEGALAYAKGKGIDVFVVRDLTPTEWGAPGRHIKFYLQIWGGEFREITVPGAQAIALIDKNPESMHLGIELRKDLARNPDYDLYSVKTGSPGPNLVSILSDSHRLILEGFSRSPSLVDSKKDLSVEIVAETDVDFTSTDYKQLRLPSAAVRISHIRGKFIARLDQSEMHFDRGRELDFAVVIENYISEQRMIAHRKNNDCEIKFKNVDPDAEENSNALKNGTILRVIAQPWVAISKDHPTKRAKAQQSLRILVDIHDGKPKLALQAVPLPMTATRIE